MLLWLHTSLRATPLGPFPSLTHRDYQSVYVEPRSEQQQAKMQALIALLAFATLASSEDPTPVDVVRHEFFNLENTLWKNVTDPSWFEAGLGGDIELSKVFVTFADQIQEIKHSNRPPINSWLWSKAVEKLQIVEGMYKIFVQFVRRQSQPGTVPAPAREWLDLANSVLVDPKTSTINAIKKLDDLLEHGDMFRSVLQEDHPDLCELQMSPHQLIFDMYNTISLTEIKGYAMMQFSWMLLRIYGKGNFTQEANLTREKYAVRASKTATAARAALNMAKRDLYRCDPAIPVEGETYAQITRLLQGYIENEVDMNSEGTCRENCGAYNLAQSHSCYQDQFCAKQTRCSGRIFDCRYIDSDMWVCLAGKNSERRYEWIEYENGKKLGITGNTCATGVTKVDSWWRILKLQHCSYCACLCEDAISRSERTFSLREAISEVERNKIVTGVRLVKTNRVFHLQISEGTLGERGSVTPGGWVPIKIFNPSDPDLIEGVDIHTLSYEKRAIDLDELHSPTGYILTGIRFRMLGAHLHFEIRSTPFNYTTGRLFPEKSQWLSNDNTDGAEKPRTKLQLQNPDIPTRTRELLQVDSNHDQYIEFTHSDFSADAAQSTVPFIDIQPIQPLDGAALLSGAGVIHRGKKDNGGYIALKLFTYNYSKHVRAEKPPVAEDSELPDVIVN